MSILWWRRKWGINRGTSCYSLVLLWYKLWIQVYWWLKGFPCLYLYIRPHLLKCSNNLFLLLIWNHNSLISLTFAVSLQLAYFLNDWLTLLWIVLLLYLINLFLLMMLFTALITEIIQKPYFTAFCTTFLYLLWWFVHIFITKIYFNVLYLVFLLLLLLLPWWLYFFTAAWFFSLYVSAVFLSFNIFDWCSFWDMRRILRVIVGLGLGMWWWMKGGDCIFVVEGLIGWG